MPTIEAEDRLPVELTARALIEAMPYLRAWSGKVVLVKYGGAAMTDPALGEQLMQDLALLHSHGVRMVLVHGGGKAVSELGGRLGLQARFVDGLRVTDEETMRVAQMVQVGLLSRDLCAELGRAGAKALGLSGHDLGGWLKAKVRQHTDRATGEPVDLGRVGDVVSVDAPAIHALLQAGLIPVIAPVAVDDHLRALNVNADSVAMAVAGALQAEKLVFFSDTPGVRGPDGEIASEVSAATLTDWMASGVVSGGMIPKAEACLSALRAGVRRVTISDGRTPHALLVELLTPAGVGTMVVP